MGTWPYKNGRISGVMPERPESKRIFQVEGAATILQRWERADETGDWMEIRP